MKHKRCRFLVALIATASMLGLVGCGPRGEAKECYRLTELGARFANAAIEEKKETKAAYAKTGLIPVKYLDDSTTEPVKEGEIVEGEAKFVIPFSEYEGNASNLFLLGTRSAGELTQRADDQQADVGGLIYPSTTLSKDELTAYRLKTNPEGEGAEKYTIQSDVFNVEQQLEVEYTLTSTDGTFKPTQGVILDYDVTLLNDRAPERKTDDPDMPVANLSYEISYNKLAELKESAEAYLKDQYVSFNRVAEITATITIPEEYTREFAVEWLKSEEKAELSLPYVISDSDGNSLTDSLELKFTDDVLPELYKNNTRVSSISLGGGTDFEPASREVLTKYCKELIEKSGDTYQVIDEIDGEIDFKFGFEYDEGHEYEASLIAEDKSGNVIKAYDASTKISSERVEEHKIENVYGDKVLLTFMRDHIRYFFDGDTLMLSTPDYDYFKEHRNDKAYIINTTKVITNNGNSLQEEYLISGFTWNETLVAGIDIQTIYINVNISKNSLIFKGSIGKGADGIFFPKSKTVEFDKSATDWKNMPAVFYFEGDNQQILGSYNHLKNLTVSYNQKAFQ